MEETLRGGWVTQCKAHKTILIKTGHTHQLMTNYWLILKCGRPQRRGQTQLLLLSNPPNTRQSHKTAPIKSVMPHQQIHRQEILNTCVSQCVFSIRGWRTRSAGCSGFCGGSWPKTLTEKLKIMWICVKSLNIWNIKQRYLSTCGAWAVGMRSANCSCTQCKTINTKHAIV